MVSELKVYNRFDELTLHVRLALDQGLPKLLVVDGTPEMQAAVISLKGIDFDRTVVKDNAHLRFTANWGSAEYLNVLARYFVANFGWRTKIVEAEGLSTEVYVTASGNFAPVYFGVPVGRPASNTWLSVNINENFPESQPRAETNLGTLAKPTSSYVLSVA
jgi:hypothetical protein